MNTMKKRVAQVLAGVVGLASVATAGVALAANGDRSPSPGVGATPTAVATNDARGHEGPGELEQGDDHGQHAEQGDDHGRHAEQGDDHGQHAEQGDDHGRHGANEPGEDHHGGNRGPGSDDGGHGDHSGPGSDG